MRIKNLPSIESMDGSQDALVIEQTDGSEDKSRKVSPAQIKQYVLNDMDEVPTENSNNPVKSGGIFSTMAVPKYDATNRREYFEGGSAFSGNIDSSPTAGSNNAVASGGTLSALNRKCSVATYNWNLGSVTADTVYILNNFKSTVGLSGKSIIAVGTNYIVGSGNYDYGAGVNYRNSADFVGVKVSRTQTNTTVNLYIIYTD